MFFKKKSVEKKVDTKDEKITKIDSETKVTTVPSPRSPKESNKKEKKIKEKSKDNSKDVKITKDGSDIKIATSPRENDTTEEKEKNVKENIIASASVATDKSITMEDIPENTDSYFDDTVILNRKQEGILNYWYGDRTQKWSLYYRASRDGFSAQQFHTLCDSKGATFTILKTKKGNIFGGYTAQSWKSETQYLRDRSAFLFTLVNPHGIKPTKYALEEPDYAIRTHEDHGPTFGDGYDIIVDSDADVNHTSHTNFPHSYTDTTGKGKFTFDGEYNFMLEEMEVYGEFTAVKFQLKKKI